MIDIINVVKEFGSNRVLDGLNLTVDKGAVYGLIGENGTGKSTLLRMIAGSFPVDGGEIKVSNQLIYENTGVKSNMIYVPDNPYFYGTGTLKQLKDFYKSIYGEFDERLYEELIKVFGLNENKRLRSFSKGMKKQCQFIVTIASKVELLLFDELVDGIDPIKRKIIWSVVMRQVAEGKLTVIIASHNIRELDGVCSHIGIIREGRCALEGDIELIKEESGKSLEQVVVDHMGGINNEIHSLLG